MILQCLGCLLLIFHDIAHSLYTNCQAAANIESKIIIISKWEKTIFAYFTQTAKKKKSVVRTPVIYINKFES